MRAISGRFKGVAPAMLKTGTRPIMDCTKEAIFSYLDSWGVLDDAHMPDLFAGTGALDIEALSRDARELVAMENSRSVAALITKTLAQLQKNRSWDVSFRARVPVKKVEQVADDFGKPFDVIFIDPPYAYETVECNQPLSDLAAGSVTNENTVIMSERSVCPNDSTAPGGWQITESRSYDETAAFYIESADDDPDIERSDDFAA